MKKIKLTDLQEKKLTECAKQISTIQNEFEIVKGQLNSATKHQQSILDMICEFNGIDPKSILPGTKMNIKDQTLTIGTETASERIRKEVKKKT